MVCVYMRHLFLLIILVLMCIGSYLYLCQRRKDGDYVRQPSFPMEDNDDQRQTFKIAWFRKPRWIVQSFDFTPCKFQNCKFINKKNEMGQAAAVIFHYRFLAKTIPKKFKGQKWILWNRESPANDKKLPAQWRGQFDLSATYRLDSDIHVSWKLKRRNKPIYKNYTNIFEQKTRHIAWVVSNCKTPSKRHKYVKQFEKYTKVDKYGHCGGNKEFCRNKTSTECHNILSQKYRFYLGFENSICKDYVTEKVFHNFLDGNNMVYIVRGAPNIKAQVPGNTFINTNDFKSPRHLADFLNALKSDKEKYISFLKEKNKYLLLANKTERAYCSLCQLLNTSQKTKPGLRGRNFNKWFSEDDCFSPKDIS